MISGPLALSLSSSLPPYPHIFLVNRASLLAKFAPDGYLVDTAASYRSFNTAGGQSPSFLDFFIIFPPKSLERLGLAGYLLFRYAGVKERQGLPPLEANPS